MGLFSGRDNGNPGPGEAFAEGERRAAVRLWNAVHPDDPHDDDGNPVLTGAEREGIPLWRR